MNELVFFSHIFLLLAFTYIASRLGKYALMALCTLQIVLANLFVTKEITLFSFTVTPTDAYAIGSLVGLTLLQEHYGKEEANKLAQINFFILLFFAAMAIVQMIYHPSPLDRSHDTFVAILSTTPRVFIASILSLYFTQKLDIELFSRFRKKFPLNLAMIFSLAISQAFDTIAFSCLGLYGLVHSLSHIIFVSYFVKMVAMTTMVPFTNYLRKKAA